MAVYIYIYLLFIYILTSRIVLEKLLLVPQLVKKFPAFNENASLH